MHAKQLQARKPIVLSVNEAAGVSIHIASVLDELREIHHMPYIDGYSMLVCAAMADPRVESDTLVGPKVSQILRTYFEGFGDGLLANATTSPFVLEKNISEKNNRNRCYGRTRDQITTK